MVKDTTLYDRLKLSTDATESQIKKSYIQLSKIWHPDKHPEEQKEEASKKFQDIKQAYDILQDEQKRRVYDQVGMDMLQHGDGSGPPDPFGGGGFPFPGFPGMPFGGGFPGMNFGMNGGRQQHQEQSEPIVVDVTVTLEQISKEELVEITYPCNYCCLSCNGEGTASGNPNLCGSCNGQGKKVQVVRMGHMIQQSITDCPMCRGKGTVINIANSCKDCLGEGKNKKQKTRSVPLQGGLDNGHKMNIQGKGHYLKYGARTDLIVVIRVKPHAQFKRHQTDLYTMVPLTLYQALFGYKKTILLPNGTSIVVQQEGRTEPNTVQCIAKEGMKHIQSGERGSLYLLFTIVLPELRVIPECKPLLESLDPTEVEKEKAATEHNMLRQPVPHDSVSIHSIYYQLVQQEKMPEEHESRQSHHQGQGHGQPQCVQQ